MLSEIAQTQQDHVFPERVTLKIYLKNFTPSIQHNGPFYGKTSSFHFENRD